MSPAMRKGLKRKEQKKTKAIIYFEDDVISLLLQESFLEQIERRSVTSRYRGSTISGWQQNQRRRRQQGERQTNNGCLPFTRIFREIRFENKWNTTFWVFPTENFREQRNIWKGSPVFPDEIFLTEIRVPFPQPSLIPVWGLRGRFPLNGTDLYKW